MRPLKYQQKFYACFFALLCLLNVGSSYAATKHLSVPDTPRNVSAETAAWHVSIAPYIWAMNMNGRIQTGSQTMHLTQTFGEILQDFQSGGMLFIDAKKNNLGFFANALYSVLEQKTTVDSLSVRSHTDFGIFSAGASYTVFNKTLADQVSTISIDPYAGARYTLNNTTLTVATLSTTNNQQWTDPIVGLRVQYDPTRQWAMIVAGDVGGTNLGNDRSYNTQGFVGYRLQSFKNTTLYAGYRLLYQRYKTGSGSERFVWDMKLFGPVAGVTIDF